MELYCTSLMNVVLYRWAFFVLAVVHCMKKVPHPCRVCDFPFLSLDISYITHVASVMHFSCLAYSEFVFFFIFFCFCFFHLFLSHHHPNLLLLVSHSSFALLSPVFLDLLSHHIWQYHLPSHWFLLARYPIQSIFIFSFSGHQLTYICFYILLSSEHFFPPLKIWL